MSHDLTTCNVVITVNTIQDVLLHFSVHDLYSSWFKWICVRVHKSFLLVLRSCDKSLWRPSVHWGVQAQSRDGTSENTRRASAASDWWCNKIFKLPVTCGGLTTFTETVLLTAGFGSGDDVLPRGRHRQRYRHFQTNYRALPVWAGLCCLSEADWTRLLYH